MAEVAVVVFLIVVVLAKAQVLVPEALEVEAEAHMLEKQ